MRYKRGGSEVQQKTLEQFKEYFDEVKGYIESQHGKLTSKQQNSLAAKYHFPWSILRITISLGYINRIARGEYEVPSQITKEQILKVVETKNKIAKGIMKFKDIRRQKGTGKAKAQSTPQATGKRKYTKKAAVQGKGKYVVVSGYGRLVSTENGIRKATEVATNEAMKEQDVFYVAKIVKSVAITFKVKNL